MSVAILTNFGDAIETECTSMAVIVKCRKCGTMLEVSDLHKGKVVTVTCAKCRHAQVMAIPMETSREPRSHEGAPESSAEDPSNAHGTARSEESSTPRPAYLRRSSWRWVRPANEFARKELMLELSACEKRLSLLEQSALGLSVQTSEEEVDWCVKHPPVYAWPRFSVAALLHILFGPLASGLYIAGATRQVNVYKNPLENVIKKTEKESQDLGIRVRLLRKIVKSSGLLPEVVNYLGPGLLSILCYIVILIIALALAPLLQSSAGRIIRLVALIGGFLAALVIWRVNTPLYVALQWYRLWPQRRNALPRERFSYWGICFLALFLLIVLSWLVGRGIDLSKPL